MIIRAAKNLPPAYFAFVMATGIVSIAAFLLKMDIFAWGLFGVNVIAYTMLWIFTLIRLFKYSADFLTDFTDHAQGPGFFTIVAGTCVLGSQFVIVAKNLQIASGLWILGTILWCVIIYSFFTAVIVKKGEKPPLGKGLNGTWLIAIVATQAVSLLGTLVAPSLLTRYDIVYFFTLIMYFIGGMLYIVVITLIFYRLAFYPLSPETATPPYWIAMGAAAITTLAGALLILNSDKFSLLQEILPFLKGFTLFFWAIASWWIPLLVIIFIVWRHVYKRHAFQYTPQYWGMVFPLGMYTVCTYQLSKALNLTLLAPIPGYFVYIAIIAWIFTFVGFIKHLMINGVKQYRELRQ